MNVNSTTHMKILHLETFNGQNFPKRTVGGQMGMLECVRREKKMTKRQQIDEMTLFRPPFALGVRLLGRTLVRTRMWHPRAPPPARNAVAIERGEDNCGCVSGQKSNVKTTIGSSHTCIPYSWCVVVVVVCCRHQRLQGLQSTLPSYFRQSI